MKIIDTKKENNKIVYTIEANPEEWKKQLVNTKKRLAKNLSLHGFRKGHVPQKIIDETISLGQVINSSLDKFVNNLANNFIYKESHKYPEIIPGSLKVDLKEVDDNKLILTFEFEKQPKIELRDYDKIKLDYKEPTASEKEIAFELKNLLKNDYMLSPKKDETIAKGDMVKFNFDGYVDGKPIQGGKAENYELEIGSGLFIPGFEDQMIGMKKNEKKTIEVTFPKDYPMEEYSNKKAKFNLFIKEINFITPPTIDKEYLSKFNFPNVTNEAELREYIKKEIIRVKGADAKQDLVKTVNDWIIKNIKMDYIPDYLIKTQMNSMKQDFDARAKNQFNKKLEDAIKDMGYKSMDEFTQKLRESAIANIKFTLGMDTLMKLLDVKVTNADVEREIQQTANMYKLNVEDLKKNTSIVNSLKTYMLNDKIMDKLLEINNKKSKTETKEEKPKAEVKE